MEAFSRLYQSIDQTTSTNAKVASMSDYFRTASQTDAAWAVYFLSGRRLKRLVGPALLREWLSEESELPAWLVEEAYSRVGDLAETVALLLTRPDAQSDNTSLANWVEQRILTLRDHDLGQQRTTITGWWASLSYEHCFIVNKLLTGALRVGVSQLLVARAVAAYANLPRALILHRLMGEWQPTAEFWQSLIDPNPGDTVVSRPYPFCLASPLDQSTDTLGHVSQWLAEWKWDGIRAQLIRREGQTFIWSRGEELIGQRYPEIERAAQGLPNGTVIDGEILAWNDYGVMPFSELQKRINRKTVGKKLLSDVPCRFLAYDLIEHERQDIRTHALIDRRKLLEALITLLNANHEPQSNHPVAIELSQLVEADDWASLSTLREESRSRSVEGLMLKHAQALYHTGRKRGHWWKWKVDPYTVDAVMIYAQAGHGRRANLHTDYTFAVWREDTLVPIAKAYSGLDNTEVSRLDNWIRRNTIEKFGPVRSVKPVQVFELAFEGISLSTRHKSGIAVRFPRIARWREDLQPKDADSLESVRRLIDMQ